MFKIFHIHLRTKSRRFLPCPFNTSHHLENSLLCFGSARCSQSTLYAVCWEPKLVSPLSTPQLLQLLTQHSPWSASSLPSSQDLEAYPELSMFSALESLHSAETTFSYTFTWSCWIYELDFCVRTEFVWISFSPFGVIRFYPRPPVPPLCSLDLFILLMLPPGPLRHGSSCVLQGSEVDWFYLERFRMI